MNIFIAIILLFLARVLAMAVNMRMTSALLGAVLDVGVIAIIVIFQPELRRFLNNIGRTAGNNTFIRKLLRHRQTEGMDEDAISELSLAVKQMAATKTGALIVIRRRDNLESIISTGDLIDARLSQRLIQNIFFKNSPLHDGAMVIGGNRILAARCTLPITDRLDIPASYGMRHKAALGIAEQCDAAVIVVSEETGEIKFAEDGALTAIDSVNVLKLKLQKL
jgi:uncharacterized protein (TIGR00159 family)